MISETLAALRISRNRIHHYRRLLKAARTELGRKDTERRLAEERIGFEELAARIFPMSFTMPHSLSGSRSSEAEQGTPPYRRERSDFCT
ncbi:hypothetical protein [Bradyrhizobium macuxiense]|uniref:hypothetical protein n=1 Tax=Bradyrhizobium macuxiense TaxID=1755647 RepID=UPI001ABF143B|nr:hypothetical protein [Bradyrhizobium macuxiense]